MREIKIEDYLRDSVKSTGGEVRKLVWLARRGAPDRVVGWPDGTPPLSLIPGPVHILAEVKKPNGPGAEAHQKREHERLRAIGFIVVVVHTKEDVDALVRRYGPQRFRA